MRWERANALVQNYQNQWPGNGQRRRSNLRHAYSYYYPTLGGPKEEQAVAKTILISRTKPLNFINKRKFVHKYLQQLIILQGCRAEDLQRRSWKQNSTICCERKRVWKTEWITKRSREFILSAKFICHALNWQGRIIATELLLKLFEMSGHMFVLQMKHAYFSTECRFFIIVKLFAFESGILLANSTLLLPTLLYWPAKEKSC